MSQVLERLQVALGERYAIEREVGRGGMATVLLARDLKHDRRVAIKVLRPDLASYGYHPERFLREIRIVAGLTHPQILPLHDSGERDGLLYYVMPFVQGGTLRHRLEAQRQLDIGDSIRIATRVAAALDYAHRQDVVHRDVKPENIFLQDDQPLVADFGVARAISECCDELTVVGLAVGTPAYMSPEQASGDDDLDGRSDLYSLACVLYEMLTGRPPFEAGNARRTMTQHVVASVPRVLPLRADVPPAVEEVVMKALAKEPTDRFATTAEFGGALRQAMSHPASDAPASGVLGRGQQRVAVLPFVNASSDPESEFLSDGITDELINVLAKVENLRVVSRTSVFALKGQQKDVRSIGALLNATVVLEGTVRTAGSVLRVTAQLTKVPDGHLLWSERYDREMKDVFAIQDEIAQTIVSTLRRTVWSEIGEPTPRRYTDNVKAYGLYLKGRYHWNRRTSDGVNEALRYFEQAIAEDPEYALAYSGLADSYALQLDYRGVPVAEGMARAKAEAERALALDETLAEAHTSLAWVTFIYDWDWAAAEREFTRAIDLNPGYATARQWYAWLLAAMGRLDGALSEGHAALEIDPASVSIRRGLGWLYYYARDAEAAVKHLRRAVTMDPTSAESHRVLTLALMQRGSLDEASTALQEALTLSERFAPVLAVGGYLNALKGDVGSARRVLAELDALAESRYVSPVAFVTLYLGLGDADRAFEWLDRAYAERRGWLAYLKVEPLFDPVRADPRFDAMLRRMQLA